MTAKPQCEQASKQFQCTAEWQSLFLKDRLSEACEEAYLHFLAQFRTQAYLLTTTQSTSTNFLVQDRKDQEDVSGMQQSRLQMGYAQSII